jgi:protein arginine N-methyltransferase 1
MYSVLHFGMMLQDGPRVAAFTESLRRSIKPGAVVVDIGCGTGYFSLLACQLGARKVYAIEPLDAIEIARECATASGFADRIEFIRGLSTQVTLPRPADVIVSDLRGGLPPHTQHFPTLIDARTRLLADDGVLICQRDRLHAALIDYPFGHERAVGVWRSLPGVDQRACRDITVNTRDAVQWGRPVRFSEPRTWATIDYLTLTHPDVAGVARWTMTEPFRAHGIGQWFDAEYAGGVTYTNGPTHPGTPAYNRMFFPWPEEVRLSVGDQVDVRINARLVGEDYVWTWETRILDTGGRALAQFSQSSLLDRPLAGARLARRSPDFMPALDDDGAATLTALSLMDGRRSQQTIAGDLAAAHPARFASTADALTFVTRLTLRFGR